MEKQMDNHVEEIFAGVVGFFAYHISHIFGIKLLEVNMMHSGYDLGNKIVNLFFGVLTACIAYLAVFFIKKYITKESK